MVTKETFIEHYTTPGHPIAFSSPGRVFQFYDGKVTFSQIESWLRGLDAYTLHKHARQPKPRNPTFVYNTRHQWQVDLVETGDLASENNNIRYLLMVIDIFSRFLWVEPLENKKADTFLKGFQEILRRAGDPPPKTILSDRGAELTNRRFQSFCKEKGIRLIKSDNFAHAPFVERVNRTFKNLVFRYLTHQNTYTFLPILQKLVESYNNRKHRMIGMSPTEADKSENTYLVRAQHELNYMKHKRKNPKLKKGQLVRISKLKGPFARGFKPNYREEIFKIHRTSTRLPYPTYTLQSYDGDEILEGNFYQSELIPVNEPELFKIESILKERKGAGKKSEVLVKWVGYKEPTWIPKKDVIDI